MPPPPLAWTQKFFEPTEPKNFLKISGEGPQPPPQTLSSVGRGHPHTPPHWRLEPRIFGSALPPSQNPKYATGPDLQNILRFIIRLSSVYRLTTVTESRQGERFKTTHFDSHTFALSATHGVECCGTEVRLIFLYSPAVGFQESHQYSN